MQKVPSSELNFRVDHRLGGCPIGHRWLFERLIERQARRRRRRGRRAAVVGLQAAVRMLRRTSSSNGRVLHQPGCEPERLQHVAAIVLDGRHSVQLSDLSRPPPLSAHSPCTCSRHISRSQYGTSLIMRAGASAGLGVVGGGTSGRRRGTGFARADAASFESTASQELPKRVLRRHSLSFDHALCLEKTSNLLLVLPSQHDVGSPSKGNLRRSAGSSGARRRGNCWR